MEKRMIKELAIDPEFSAVCPTQTEDELTGLEKSLLSEGCREPIVTWANHDDTILDGHTRYRLCTKLSLPFKTRAMTFDDRDAAIQWIIENQLSRRNLSDDKRIYLNGKWYEREKKPRGGDRKSEESKAQNDTLIRTDDRIAEKLGIARVTVQRSARYARAIDALEKDSPGARDVILNRVVRMQKGDSQAVLDLKPEDKRRVAKMIVAKEYKNVKEAIDVVQGRANLSPAPEAEQKTVVNEAERIVAVLNRVCKDIRAFAKTKEGQFIPDGGVCKEIVAGRDRFKEFVIVGPCPSCDGNESGCPACNFTGLGTARSVETFQKGETVCTN